MENDLSIKLIFLGFVCRVEQMSNEVIQAIQSQIDANIARVTDISLFQEYFQRRISNSTNFYERFSLYSRILENL